MELDLCNPVAYCTLFLMMSANNSRQKIVSEYDQEIPQLQTADKPMAP